MLVVHHVCTVAKVGFVILISRLCVLFLLRHLNLIYANELAENESEDSRFLRIIVIGGWHGCLQTDEKTHVTLGREME